jgi:hypothetical protein
MTTQIIPVKCPVLNRAKVSDHAAPVCDAVLKFVDDEPTSIMCIFAGHVALDTRLVNHYAQEVPDGQNSEGQQKRILECEFNSDECVYSRWTDFNTTIYDNNINH